ncbi:hypothetical protein SAMN05421749_103152 [Acinetobacter marinus]|uniref:Uncharacterized protein n=1 Tax=Acinetobacter marinus TaxID=281375 RepID=A0A1G6IWW8_9GAMM|nr:DUF6776 family protein [Acinetobacter marinus]SDC10256.1 hypothetical protein SAMN05421749_103152 [Acinetobacter marinus]
MDHSEQTPPNPETPPNPQSAPVKKKPFWKSQSSILMAAIALAGGGFALGYTVGHKQGLTVVGFDQDAQELAEIVAKQKSALDAVSVSLNTSTQERDVAIQNAKELNEALGLANQDKSHADALSTTYREKLRERGGLSLTIQNIKIKPLPSNAYEYVLDLVQVSPSKRRAVGRIEMRLINGGEILVVPLESANFNFDNFERLTGRWTMPSGFTPQYIEIQLSGSGEKVIQRFAWRRGAKDVASSAFLGEIPQTQADAD